MSLAPPSRRVSPAEPVSELRRVPIVECGEPLVDFLEFCPRVIQDTPRFTYRRETLVRRGLAERLRAASEALPAEYRLAVLEGWRPLHIQRRMYLRTWNLFQERHPGWSDVQMRRVVNRFTAPIGARVPPPHLTGGAVDVFLAYPDGRRLDHCRPFEAYDPRCFAFDCPEIGDRAKQTRRILAEALTAGGLTNYPSEYWHWSYGDQGWAYRGGHPHALYGPIEPDGYTPEPSDLSDEPLVRIEGA